MKKFQFPKRAGKTGDGRVFKNGTAATAVAVLALAVYKRYRIPET